MISYLKELLLSYYFYLLSKSGFYWFRDFILSIGDRLPATVLVYHRVNDFVKNSLTVSPKIFDNQMETLALHYHVISLYELIIKLKNGEKFTKGTVVITFDDGYEDNYLFAAPILKKFNLPACFFITADYIGTKKTFPWDEKVKEYSPLMNWDQVKELLKMGFDIGSHTLSHSNLNKIKPEEIEKELNGSRAILENKLKTKIYLFSFPFGSLNDIPDRFPEMIKNSGYHCNCSAISKKVYHAADPYMIPRIPINERFANQILFRLEINGGRYPLTIPRKIIRKVISAH